MHIHAAIVTDDGKAISLAADDIASIEPGVPACQLRENVTLTAVGSATPGSTD
jgi:hypothetical protein